MQYDFPIGTNIVTAVVLVLAWLPILVASAYAWLHRATIPRKFLFVSLSALLAWGASCAPTFLLMPAVVWVNSAGSSLDRADSILAAVVRAAAGPAHFVSSYQFVISIGLLAATSLWAPGFLRGRLVLSPPANRG